MEQEKIKKSGRGGAREGAGRPKGGTNAFSLSLLMESMQTKSGGQSYQELLVEDFLAARQSDKQLAQRYHHLILSKIAPSLTKVETDESTESVEQKAKAFADALAELVNHNKEK
jgi:hypothetical protein